MKIIELIFLIIVFSLVLIRAADMVIVAVRRVAKESHATVFTISAVILAIGTSLPEFFIGITSALEGSPNLAFGVVLGSNIANIALIGGASAFFVGRVFVHGEYLKRDIAISLIAAAAPLFLALDSSISRVDGLILLMVYLAYVTGFFRTRFEQIGKEQAEEGFIYRFIREFKNIESVRVKEFGRFFAGLSLLLFSGDMIVKFSTQLASAAKIDAFLIGLIILALGTSLPEFAFSLRSLKNHQQSMFLGNILGSTIANSTLIVGVTTFISPLHIIAFDEYLLGIVAFFVIFLLFWFFIKSKHRLDRWEAGVLIFLYLIFAVLEFL